MSKSPNTQGLFDIRSKIIRNVKSELLIRISKGYENIDIDRVEEKVERVLREMNAA
ncbi:hypothetical protein HYV50_00795 [Candidatus Pacearchaeota archaeon]|nr:hypothetical protein [Candidatus Pacearchaeota archaeon]